MQPASSADIRERLVQALQADLIGPFVPDDAAGQGQDFLSLPPSRWYLTGFLAPQGSQVPDADDDSQGGLAAGSQSRADPAAGATDRHTEGAACHGCLDVAESSCERFNRYLDRALMVPTIGNQVELAFFRERP